MEVLSANQSRPGTPLGRPAGALLAIAAVLSLGLAAPAATAAPPIFRGASGDGSKVFIETDEQLVSGDTDSKVDLYEHSGGTTTWLSQGEINGNGAFQAATFSGASSSGSRVFFRTEEQLVSGDTDGGWADIYERSAGATTWISGAGNGTRDAFFEGASSDGSRVFFTTSESLVSGDTDVFEDIYERSGGITTQVSQGQIHGNGAFEATFKAASSDGSRVFFETAEKLVDGDTDDEIDLYERSGGTTRWISQGQSNGNGPFDATFAGAPGDRSKGLFDTDESLVSGDTDSSTDLYERSGGTTTQVSQGEINGDGPFDAAFKGASRDGLRIFFQTDEPLVSGDTDEQVDLYGRNAGVTSWLSRGQVSNGPYDAGFKGASGDGTKVFFHTDEPLVGADTDTFRDVYQRAGGVTSRVSQGQINGNGATPAVFLRASSDGSKVIFETDEQLVDGDTDGVRDLYERSAGATTWLSQGEINGNKDHPAGFLRATSDGTSVFFYTVESLVSGDLDGAGDVYERSGGTTTLISVDTGPPRTTLGAGPSGVTNDRTPTFTFSSSEGGSSFECRFDSDLFAPCSGPGASHTATAELSDGPHVFEVRATDPAGNTDASPASGSFTVDTAPPDTTISGGPSAVTNDPTPTFAFSSQPGASFACKLDGGFFTGCGSPKTLAHLADGSHTFSVRATDPAGNVDPTPASRTFTVATAAVSVSGSTLVVTAAAGARDNLSITRAGSVLRVTDFPSGSYPGSGVHTGAGCTRSGDYAAHCNASGITAIQVAAGDRADKVVNTTGIRSTLGGGAGNDDMTGGSANDILIGGTGADVLRGMNGNDDLRARDGASDTRINCDGGSNPGVADRAELDLLPQDPDSAITGCESKSRGAEAALIPSLLPGRLR